MAKVEKDPFRCSECGWGSQKWVGRCGECQAWGSVEELAAPKKLSLVPGKVTHAATPIGDVDLSSARARATGVSELDRVLGGGLVPGAAILLAGEPGVGKSTLLLSVAAQTASKGIPALYISGEESASQVRLRAERINAVDPKLFLASETDLGAVIAHIDSVKPELLIIDSVQTIGSAAADGSPGGVTQVREVAGALIRICKDRDITLLLVGHVTKDGSIAGPRLLEHIVDVVLQFEGERHSRLRLLQMARDHVNKKRLYLDRRSVWHLVQALRLALRDGSYLQLYRAFKEVLIAGNFDALQRLIKARYFNNLHAIDLYITTCRNKGAFKT